MLSAIGYGLLIVVLIYVIVVAFKLIGGLLTFVVELLSAFTGLFGNARKGCTLVIPEALVRENLWSSPYNCLTDPNRSLIDEINTWMRYAPSPYLAPYQQEKPYEATVSTYLDRLEQRLSGQAESKVTVHEGTIAGILSPTPTSPLEDILGVATKPVSAPYAELTFNPEDNYGFPTDLEAEDVEIPELVPAPTLVLPYHSGWLTFLNAAVESTFHEQITKYKEAKKEKDLVDFEVEQTAKELKQAIRLGRQKLEEIRVESLKNFNEALVKQAALTEKYLSCGQRDQAEARKLSELLKTDTKGGVENLAIHSVAAINFGLRTYPLKIKAELDEQSQLCKVEMRVPALAEINWEHTSKRLSKKDQVTWMHQLYPAIILRAGFELARSGLGAFLKGLAVNLWCEFNDPATGSRKSAYVGAVFGTPEQFGALTLQGLDPVVALARLNGVSNRFPEVTPLMPQTKIERDDPRFVSNQDVIALLDNKQNLAAMDWEDFEHLCREVLEREFSNTGSEVRVTQASRDKGVDAVIFDPDPIRGGKIIVQAKRYSNVVDVSAVRDLYGTMLNEGAMKGLLITTSHFGSDSYQFAAGKPITLISGPELLGLLSKFGFNFRIDLEEAKKLSKIQ